MPHRVQVFNCRSNKTIMKLFGDADSYYQIPDYQRPYSWNGEQIEQMWDDVYSAMVAGEESYFLGPVILIEKGAYFEVVDGQQRLTTITILFCVLRDLYLPGDKKIANTIKSLVDQQYRIRLITALHCQSLFEDQILDGVKFPDGELNKKEREKNKFINAAMIFKEHLAKINKTQRSQFVSFLLNQVIMISIVCTKQHFAIKLFQVLNTRGLDLDNSDLIKSHLYAYLKKEQHQQQFMTTWNEIETVSKQIYESLENLFTIYEYFLLAKNPESSLFEELKKKFGPDPDANKVIFKFKKFVDCFNEIYQLESSLMNSFWYIPNQVFWKAILTTAKSEDFKEFDELCWELRRMFYSYWIAGYTSSKVKQLSFNIIGLIKAGKKLAEIKKTIANKMNLDSVIKRMADNLYNDAYGETWAKPLLALIEYNQTDDAKITRLEMDRKLHVDHILPEKWVKINYWKSNWSQERATLWLNKLGNLTLLSGKKNIAASNNSFPKKSKIYEKNGLDGMTSFIISQRILKTTDWTENEVKKRHHWIIKETEKLFDLKIGKASS
jgi:uncharacterized protein with ParB-like and HNH nuclease domain